MIFLNFVIKNNLPLAVLFLAGAIAVNYYTGFWPSLILYLVAVILVVDQFLRSPVVIDKVVIIRHGEKDINGDNLSLQGLDRSNQLPGILYQKFGVPDHVYVPALKLGKSTNYARMYQTIVPYAVKYNLMVNTRYNVNDFAGLSRAIKIQRGTALVVWEHKAINNIVKAFGVKEKLSWDDNDYDSIWIITYSNGVASINFDCQNFRLVSNFKQLKKRRK